MATQSRVHGTRQFDLEAPRDWLFFVMIDPYPSWRLPVPDQKADAANEGDVMKQPPQLTSDVHPPPGTLIPAFK